VIAKELHGLRRLGGFHPLRGESFMKKQEDERYASRVDNCLAAGGHGLKLPAFALSF
jgi:hypothetical protein